MDVNFKKLMKTIEHAELVGSVSCGAVHQVQADKDSEVFELTPREMAIFNIGVSEGVLSLASQLHIEDYAIFTASGEAVIWESEPTVAYVEGLWRDVAH